MLSVRSSVYQANLPFFYVLKTFNVIVMQC